MTNVWTTSILLTLLTKCAVSQTTETSPSTTGTTDPSVCEVFAEVISLLTPPNVCEVGESCRTLNCLLDISQFGIADHSLSLTFLPCSQMPSFRVRVTNNLLSAIVYEAVISESQAVYPDDLFGSPLNFTVNTLKSGVEFELSTKNSATFQVVALLPRTVYPIDLAACPARTCDVITALASRRTQQDCYVSPLCDGILCTLAPLASSPQLNFDLTAKILPCNNPPAVQLIIADSGNGGLTFANEILTNSSIVTVVGEPVYVTVDQFIEGLGVQVEVMQEVTGELFDSDRSSLLEYSYFPVSRDGQNCDVYSPTCLAFQTIVDQTSRGNVTCETTDACDGVSCYLDVLGSGALFEATTSLTCYNQNPAFDFILREPSENGRQGKIFLDRIIHKNTIIGILVYDIDVKLTRLPERNALGFEVTLKNSTAEEGDSDVGVSVIRYTEIPVNETAICASSTGSGATLSLSLLLVISSSSLSLLWS